MTNPVAAEKTVERFWAKVDRTSGGCWNWTSPHNGTGYGQLWGGSGPVLAHRFSYELLVGPIPEGLQLDHLCRNRLCVNPDHLEPVTRRENILRGASFAARNARKTHCPNGHPYDNENTYRPSEGERQCRVCHRERQRNRKKRALTPFSEESPK